MKNSIFRDWLHKTADWNADYRQRIRDLAVRSKIAPGAIASKLAASPPNDSEKLEAIFSDFKKIIVPGMTHWQHPRFFAYFSSNAAPAAIIAENLVAAMSAQCMLWQTSPAATELETTVIDWLRQALGLPERFSGVIQDSASSATLVAVLAMREIALDWQGNRSGLSAQPPIRIYASNEVHTSIDRAIWIAGIGEQNLVRIPVTGANRGMDAAALDAAITHDRANGYLPAGVITCVGGTSTGGCDDQRENITVAHRHGLYVHVDAAWAGSAMICPEFRTLWHGVEAADSIVFNPHKWLGVPFDCSIQFLAEPKNVIKTLAIQPEYLRTHGKDGLINYSEWSIPLGRRFRALKVWFLLRAYGLNGLQAMIRNHVGWSRQLCERLRAEDDFEIVTEPFLALFTFRHVSEGASDIDAHNQALVEAINDDGTIYLTQTSVDARIAIRFQVGQFDARKEDVDLAFDTILRLARQQ